MSEFIALVVSLALIVACIFVPADLYGRYICANYSEITKRETKWVMIDSCYIKADDGWQRYDEYKARAVASEGLKK